MSRRQKLGGKHGGRCSTEAGTRRQRLPAAPSTYARVPACQLGSKHRGRLVQHGLRTGRRRRTVWWKRSHGSARKSILSQGGTRSFPRRLTEDQADRARRDERSPVRSFRCGLATVNLPDPAACVGPAGSKVFPLEKKCHLTHLSNSDLGIIDCSKRSE